MLKRGCEFTANQVFRDDRSRCLLIQISHDAESYILGNIYAQTQDFPAEQVGLMDYLEDGVMELEASNILVDGDFNLYLDRAASCAGKISPGKHLQRKG